MISLKYDSLISVVPKQGLKYACTGIKVSTLERQWLAGACVRAVDLERRLARSKMKLHAAILRSLEALDSSDMITQRHDSQHVADALDRIPLQMPHP